MNDKQLQNIREILMKYTVPVGNADGINAWTIALMIAEAVKED